LILHAFRCLHVDAILHCYTPNNLLSQEVSVKVSDPVGILERRSSIPDLNLVQARIAVLFDVDVDWEMGVHVAHFVSVALGDTNYEVVDECLDSSKSGDILAGAVVDFD
jgi:hypothetical protein